MQSVDDLVVCLGEFIGHIEFDEVLERYPVGLRDFEGRVLLRFFLETELCA